MNNTMKQLHSFISLLAFFLVFSIIAAFSATDTFAAVKTARTSASFVTADTFTGEVNRVQILRAYLEQHNSPLAPYAYVFVNEADTHSLDWKLVAAIAGVESTFGKRIPYNSYNAWGWGVYGNKVLRFSSWHEAISTISHDLRVKYMDTWGAENVYEIGRIYAADPKWASKVIFFMNQIETFEKEYASSTLSISI